MLGKTHWSRWSGLNRRPTVYETVALPLSYTGDARSANEPVKYGHHAGAASGKFERDAFYAANGLVRLGSRKFGAQTGGNTQANDNRARFHGLVRPLKRHGVDAMTASGRHRSGQVRDPVQKPPRGKCLPRIGIFVGHTGPERFFQAVQNARGLHASEPTCSISRNWG